MRRNAHGLDDAELREHDALPTARVTYHLATPAAVMARARLLRVAMEGDSHVKCAPQHAHEGGASSKGTQRGGGSAAVRAALAALSAPR
eukprot:CAMPEP_0118828572 /NCGR_PEP_ID=MMETSP1162-20130426/18985_1 /TAXON_ID=33656 /ORGANISM="Phaeocystis Sp, Strain CCMP2710" /LENGTH=88 /DNA_ID=CAMNT_0006759595 /DNA_START=163 /DNA_END=431 /DNA_ORIENTATION=-